MWKQQHDRSIPWLGIGIIGVFLLSVALRFWGLGRFNSLVFDEVYYAKFANDLLNGKYVFYSHPPLGHYFVAVGMWIGSHLPFGNDTANSLTGSWRSTFSYRWMNAAIGSLVPLLVAGIAYQLTHRPSYALIASLLVVADGLLLVESRYALNNIYLVAFGLLGQLCFLLALNCQGRPRWVWLALAGVSFGASICVKWNGLWFLLGTIAIWLVARLMPSVTVLLSNSFYAALAGLFAVGDLWLLAEYLYAPKIFAISGVQKFVALSLLGQLSFLLALNPQGTKRWDWLALAGLSFVAAVGLNWNGLWSGLAAGYVWQTGLWLLAVAWVIWVAAWAIWAYTSIVEERERGREGERERERAGESILNSTLNTQHSTLPTTLHTPHSTLHTPHFHNPLAKLTQLNALQMVGNLGIIPAVVYGLLWIPYLLVETDSKLSLWDNFWEEQQKILNYHQGIKDGPNVHPYCSRWFTWPLMLRPIAYFYEVARNTTDPVPAFPPLPPSAGKVIYDVHAMGNPILYLLSTAAILISLWLLAKQCFQGAGWKFTPTPTTWILFYLVLNYAANFLPWVRVTRCTFLYHYMGASIFAALALAWSIDYCLHSFSPDLRAIGVTAIFLVVLALIYWMPVYLGLPLSTDGYRIRMLRITMEDLSYWLQPWLPNWV
jgi:dolichyl-phosphate-mannose--protein O-mannosyl transferase